MWRAKRSITGLACGAILLAVCAAAAYALPDTDFELVSPLGNKDSGKTETSVGDLVADSVKTVLKTDVAFVASSELKAKDEEVPIGKASSSVLANLVSYADDSLSVVEITGKSIRAALERSVSIYPQPNMGFLQVSGLRFTFSSSSASGQRVMSVMVNGKSINDDTVYKVGMTNSLASGALGYWKVWSQETPKTRVPDTTLINAVETYLKANPRIDYAKLDRITASGR